MNMKGFMAFVIVVVCVLLSLPTYSQNIGPVNKVVTNSSLNSEVNEGNSGMPQGRTPWVLIEMTPSIDPDTINITGVAGGG